MSEVETMTKEPFWVAAVAAAILSSASASAANVVSFDAFEVQFFNQIDAATPSAPYSYTFSARSFTDVPLANAGFNVVGGSTNDSLSGVSGTVFEVRHDYGSLSDLESSYPPGTSYNYSLSHPDLSGGSWTGSVTLPSPTFYAQSTPHFQNFAGTQAIDPSLPFTLSWDSFQTNPSAPLSQQFLVIRDAAQNVILDQFFADSGLKSYELAAGALLPGHQYTATLYFSSRNPNAGIDQNGMSGLGSYDLATNLHISTVPVPGALWLLAPALATLRLRRRVHDGGERF